MSNQFCLKWNNYQLSLTTAFKHILEAEDFVDVTLSAESQNLKAHKVVLSACSSYFKVLLKGISPWQHPVLVLRDVPFLDLQSILEFVYLGEVNVEQERLESFLKTAEVLQIKGLTDGLKDSAAAVNGATRFRHQSAKAFEEVSGGLHLAPTPQQKRSRKSMESSAHQVPPPPPLILHSSVGGTPEKRPKMLSGQAAAAATAMVLAAVASQQQNLSSSALSELSDQDNNMVIDDEYDEDEDVADDNQELVAAAAEKKNSNSDSSVVGDTDVKPPMMTTMVSRPLEDINENYDEGEYIDDGEEIDNEYEDGSYIMLTGDAITSANAGGGGHLTMAPGGEKEDLGPLHKRCPVCHMIMLKKNLSRHVRDQHTMERPRSVCPVCRKTYKTADWLKDHIRRGHGYSKEATDEVMAKVRADQDGGNINSSTELTAGGGDSSPVQQA